MLVVIGIWTLFASVVAAALYAWDKRAAIKDKRRIPERSLLIWSALGGWPGSMIAGRILRHKTVKMAFRLQFAACVMLHLAVIGFLVWNS